MSIIWVNKQNVVYLHNGVLFSRKITDFQATKWMNIEITVLNERRWHVAWFYLYEMSTIGNCIDTEGKLLFSEGLEGVPANGYGVYFGGDKNVLELDNGDGYTNSWIY